MKNHISRREFINRSIAVGIGAVSTSIYLPSTSFGKIFDTAIDISVIDGTEYFNNTIKAVELLGGIDKFVPKGSVVGIIANSPWERPGTYTNPDITLSVLKMCIDAGAKEIYSIENAQPKYWKRSNLFEKFEKEIDQLKSISDKSTIKIDKGKAAKQVDISKTLLDCDVLINIPIAKNHRGTNFTGNLKNLMGATSRSTNRFFHSGGDGGDADEFLSQCIADVNLIRRPNLCIVDATEFVTTNGPAGPGKISKAQKIVAGTNCVSVDAYSSTLLGLNPADVLMIKFAHEHGIGEIDLKKLNIKEI